MNLHLARGGAADPLSQFFFRGLAHQFRTAELLQQLAHTYLGPEVRFPLMDNPPPGYITHISVDRVAGVGPWAEQR